MARDYPSYDYLIVATAKLLALPVVESPPPYQMDEHAQPFDMNFEYATFDMALSPIQLIPSATVHLYSQPPIG